MLHCHGVLALRRGPLTGAVQDASQLQGDAGKLEAGSAKGSFDRSCAGRKPAARGRRQVGSWQCRKGQGLELVSLVASESDVWQCGLPAAGPIRPSLPWCFGAATRSSHRSCAGRKPAARGRRQVGSWQCRKGQGLELVSSRFRK